LLNKVTELVSKLPTTVLFDDIEEEKLFKYVPKDQYTIEKHDDVFEVSGSWVKVVMESTNFEDPDSISYFQRSLVNSGVIEALKKAGIKEGDTVKIADWEFDFIE